MRVGLIEPATVEWLYAVFADELITPYEQGRNLMKDLNRPVGESLDYFHYCNNLLFLLSVILLLLSFDIAKIAIFHTDNNYSLLFSLRMLRQIGAFCDKWRASVLIVSHHC